MRSVMTALLLLATLGILGCERDLPFEATVDLSIQGYQVEGYVTDRLGVPMRNVRIALWYDFVPFGTNTPPSRSLYVDDSSKSILLRALDLRGRIVKVVYSGKAPVGELDYSWNNTDSLGRAVPSGVYQVELRLDNVVRNSYTVIVNGAVTAVTDSLGHYIIGNDYLPVDFAPAPLYSSDGKRFLGNYKIAPFIGLDFQFDIVRRISVTLKKDEITRTDLRL